MGDMSCDEPMAEFMRESIIVRDSFGNWTCVFFIGASEFYCGLFNDCLTVCFFSLFCIS